jgi:hypothetical protein
MWFFLLLLLTSCTARETLRVQSDFITRESLASDFVGTPDPKRFCPPQGQRIVISWSLPPSYLEYQNLKMILTIRLEDRTELQKVIPIFKKRGTYEYRLINEEYYNSGGIQTYKVDLMSNDFCLEAWRHQLWVERIIP